MLNCKFCIVVLLFVIVFFIANDIKYGSIEKEGMFSGIRKGHREIKKMIGYK